MERRSNNDYQPFVVGNDGEIVVHGHGPGDADEAVRRANRQVDPDARPKITHRDIADGEYHGVQISSGGEGRKNDPDACPHCHMQHPDPSEFVDHPELRDVDCQELIASAQEILPGYDPHGDYCTLSINVTCAASTEDVQGVVDEVMKSIPKPLGATIMVNEETFLTTVSALARTSIIAELAETAGEVLDVAAVADAVKRDARNN